MIVHYALCIMNYLRGGIYLRSFMIMHYALCMMNYLKGSISLRSYKQEFRAYSFSGSCAVGGCRGTRYNTVER